MKSATTTTKMKDARSWPESTRKHLHSKTRPHDYHDNVAHSVFYSNRVTTSRPIATSKQKHPVIL